MTLDQQQDDVAEPLPIASEDVIDKSAARRQMLSFDLPEIEEPDREPESKGESPEGEPETAEPDSVPDDSPKQAAKPKTLQDLADRLEIEVKDIYAIEFPDQEGGDSHTIGELANVQAKESDFSRRELEFSERMVTEENKLLQSSRELSVVMKGIPVEVLDQKMLAEASAVVKAAAADEAEKVLDIIPSWNDVTVRETELKAIAEHLADYGFSRAELDRISDHRFVKYFRDNWMRAERVAKSLSEVEEIKTLPKGRGASKPAGSRSVQVPHTEAEKLAARQQLFNA